MTASDAGIWLRNHGSTVLCDVVVNVLAPFAIYLIAKPHWGDVAALMLASLPPLSWSLGGFIRKRTLDALSILVLAGIALSLLAFLGGGSVRFLQLREKLVTLLIGLAFLGSAAIGKPLVWPLARAVAGRRSKEALAKIDARAGDAALRRIMMTMTLIWGGGLVAEFALAVILIYTLPVAEYLIVGPILGYATIGTLVLWTTLYRRRARQRTRHARLSLSVADDGPDRSPSPGLEA